MPTVMRQTGDSNTEHHRDQAVDHLWRGRWRNRFNNGGQRENARHDPSNGCWVNAEDFAWVSRAPRRRGHRLPRGRRRALAIHIAHPVSSVGEGGVQVRLQCGIKADLLHRLLHARHPLIALLRGN